MSGRLLTFSQYLGGADNVKVLELFPSTQRRFTYNFATDVTGWDFTADYQTIVLDQITYDRSSEPVFSNTQVIGYFEDVGTVDPNTYIQVTNSTSGIVEFTIPADRYTGQLLPNARNNVVMTVVSFEWTRDTTPPTKELHRWAIMERWEPGVTPGNPTLETVANGGYVSLVGV